MLSEHHMITLKKMAIRTLKKPTSYIVGLNFK